jgi:hypothetical protein
MFEKYFWFLKLIFNDDGNINIVTPINTALIFIIDYPFFVKAHKHQSKTTDMQVSWIFS